MTNRTRSLGTALALAFALALVPLASPAQAQMAGEAGKWSIDGRGGIAVPAGDLADAVDVSPAFGLGVAYRIHPRVSVRVDGDLAVYSGAEAETGSGARDLPDLHLWHFVAGVGVELTDPGASRWEVTALAGAGATTIDGDPFNAGTAIVEGRSETDFTASGGLRLGYDVNGSVSVFADGRWHLVFTGDDDQPAVPDGGPGVSGLDSASSLPLTVGARVTF